MKYIKSVSLIAMVFVLSSCYHATIVTDKTPSTTVIEKPWASSFVFGLVPPKIVETASKCPNGVAKVETQMSFVNGLVSALTFNLYTPMDIKVTCAAGSTASVYFDNAETITVSKNATEEEKINVFQEASDHSFVSGKAVYVHMR